MGPKADFLIQGGFADQIRFHGKRYPWFVSDVTKKDWNWLLNSMVYGQLFSKATDQEKETLRRLGLRWKVKWNSSKKPSIHTDQFSTSNTRKRANGSMNNIHSGALATRSGSCIAKRLTFSCIYRNPT